MSGPLAGKVCVVTGASRGIGKGIALQLGEAGAIVYITGRTLLPTSNGGIGGSLQETAEEVTSRGGKCIPVKCDHGKDEDIKQLFEQIKEEQNGRLDILVNNAYSAGTAITDSMNADLEFWEEDIGMWDTVNNVGFRGHYLGSVYASRLMVPAKQGLIVNISSAGGLFHMANVLYCLGKSGMDRMASDCAIGLRKHNIAMVSLWPGPTKTEYINKIMEEDHISDTKDESGPVQGTQIKFKMSRALFEQAESPEFAGKAIIHLATDPNIMKKSGKILNTPTIAQEFGYSDINGEQHPNPFSLKYGLIMSGHSWLAAITPGFFKIPNWMIAASFQRFY